MFEIFLLSQLMQWALKLMMLGGVIIAIFGDGATHSD